MFPAPAPIRAHAAIVLFEGHHRGLSRHIEGIAAALTACLAGPRWGLDDDAVEGLRSHMRDLRRFAEQHFAAEEKLMADVFYPEWEAHRERHRAFLVWLSQLESVAEEDPRRLRSAGTAAMLAGWWEAHASGPDRDLTDFLCRGGF